MDLEIIIFRVFVFVVFKLRCIFGIVDGYEEIY